MNMFKNAGGFTLVELIVVIAILAILAGVAVPAYSGYINEANEAADQQEIEAIETAMSAALAMKGIDVTKADEYFDVTFANHVLTVVKAAVADGATKPVYLDDVWSAFASFYKGATTPGNEYTVTLKLETKPTVSNITVGDAE